MSSAGRSAPPLVDVSLVLASALATAVIACGVAVGIALVLVYALVPELLDPASAIAAPGFPWKAAGVGLAAALAGAVAGAVYPAAVAARIDMALALRDLCRHELTTTAPAHAAPLRKVRAGESRARPPLARLPHG